MALNDTILNIGGAAMQTAMTHGKLYSAAPDAAGSTNATAGGRVALTWTTAANGDMIVTADAAFTGGGASAACTVLGFWSASTAGTFYGYVPLTGDATFNAAGEYTVTGVTITGTAS